MDRIAFAKRIEALRLRAGFRSVRALAKKAKVAQPTMRAIEKGETDPDLMELGNFMKLVALLKTNPVYLYDGVGRDGPPDLGRLNLGNGTAPAPVSADNNEKQSPQELAMELLGGARRLLAAWLSIPDDEERYEIMRQLEERAKFHREKEEGLRVVTAVLPKTTPSPRVAKRVAKK